MTNRNAPAEKKNRFNIRDQKQILPVGSMNGLLNVMTSRKVFPQVSGTGRNNYYIDFFLCRDFLFVLVIG